MEKSHSDNVICKNTDCEIERGYVSENEETDRRPSKPFSKLGALLVLGSMFSMYDEKENAIRMMDVDYTASSEEESESTTAQYKFEDDVNEEDF